MHSPIIDVVIIWIVALAVFQAFRSDDEELAKSLFRFAIWCLVALAFGIAFF